MDIMPINYNVISDADKYAVCYRLQELLRLEHNETGAKYKAGIITKAQWIDYLENTFSKKEDQILKDLLILRQKIKEDQTINTSLNDVII